MMIRMTDFEIKAEYTGQEPNLRPAASAFARMIKKITNPDGTFTDPDLEAEYQDWIKKRRQQVAAADDGREVLTNETP
jgi:hypothetical protein